MFREAAATEAFVAPEVRTDATPEDFDGVWVGPMIDMMGMQMPLESMNLGMKITISAGKAEIVEIPDGDEKTLSTTGTFADATLTLGSKEDGKLIPLQLRADGSMSYSEDNLATIYFEKAE